MLPGATTLRSEGPGGRKERAAGTGLPAEVARTREAAHRVWRKWWRAMTSATLGAPPSASARHFRRKSRPSPSALAHSALPASRAGLGAPASAAFHGRRGGGEGPRGREPGSRVRGARGWGWGANGGHRGLGLCGMETGRGQGLQWRGCGGGQGQGLGGIRGLLWLGLVRVRGRQGLETGRGQGS